MQTVPTDFIEAPDSEENEDEEEVWGRMFPLGSSFISVGNCMKSHSCRKSATRRQQFCLLQLFSSPRSSGVARVSIAALEFAAPPKNTSSYTVTPSYITTGTTYTKSAVIIDVSDTVGIPLPVPGRVDGFRSFRPQVDSAQVVPTLN